jgi:hypothetical protein
MAQSLAIEDSRGQVIGGAFNETMPPLDVEPEVRQDDPFMAAVLTAWEPVITSLGTQDAEALTALATKYPGFQEAYAQGKVVHHALVARSDALAQADTFEIVSASAERHQAFGYAFIVTEATNQWTGEAFEALGGVRGHFAPFQAQRTTA